MKTLGNIISILILHSAISAQVPIWAPFSLLMDSKIENPTIDVGGKISWSTLREKENILFEIQEFRWNKWNTVGQLNGQGYGSHYYSFKADTSCGGFYELRIIGTIAGNGNFFFSSKSFKYPLEEKEVHFIGCSIDLKLSAKTKFEIFNNKGTVVLSGCSNFIKTRDLPSGVYFINYSNKTGEFIRK